ncbi:MAG: Gfo/Idh/MocA family oxidoreductase [Candidatus Heimdallarchaeota archaeon]|nr:Gfo/Idh/MocA family oxidoreductase [Candidatus Heimdallarchaeota archaeon]
MRKMETLNIAVIGVGSWGKNHARVFSEMENVNLHSIHDLNYNHASELAKIHNTQAIKNLDDLLKNEEIDAITIATPTSAHAEIALQAIGYGKHVLVEKPMTSTIEEAEKILDAEKQNNVIVSVGFIERFNPIVYRSKQLIQNEELGELVLISARRLGPYWPDRLKDVDVIRDVSIHDIDAFRYLISKEPKSVYARGGKLRHTYLDYAEILLDFGNGVTGFIESNYLTPHKLRKLMLTCEKGIVEADYISQEYVIEDAEWLRNKKMQWQEPLSKEMNAFIEACRGNAPPVVTSLDGINALKIALSSILSIESHKVIDLDL